MTEDQFRMERIWIWLFTTMYLCIHSARAPHVTCSNWSFALSRCEVGKGVAYNREYHTKIYNRDDLHSLKMSLSS
jgi:hypothetical protein